MKSTGAKNGSRFKRQKDETETCSTVHFLPQRTVQDERELLRKPLHDSWMLEASPDELAVALLLRVFTMATPVLCDYVTQRMKRRFGERKWFDKILQGLGRSRLRPRLEKQPNTLRHDIHIVTKIFLNEIETVVYTDGSGLYSTDIDKVKLDGILLQRIAVEVDCIGETRNALHHGISLSASEVLLCLQSLERLWLRMEPEELPRHAMDELQENTQVSKNKLEKRHV